jgi:hypothetical protein
MNEAYGNMLASALAGASSSAFFHPLDVLRIRWQQQCGPLTTGSLAGFTGKIVRQARFASCFFTNPRFLRQEGLVRGLVAPALGTQAPRSVCVQPYPNPNSYPS